MTPTVFETDRLLVRVYEPDDAPFVLGMRFLGASPKPLQTLEEASYYGIKAHLYQAAR